MNETPAEKAEARAIRRRWINIGELVAVAGVIIAAVSLWLTWSGDRAKDAETKAEKTAEAQKAGRVTLVGQVAKDRITLSDAAKPISSIDVTFPKALGASDQSSILEPRIDADWFARPLLALTDGGPDNIEGRVPALITATSSDGDSQSVDRAIYDVVFVTKGHTIGGRSVQLRGIRLRQRVHGDGGQATIDGLWASEAKRLEALKQK